jgi:alanine-synthesizing transaminase
LTEIAGLTVTKPQGAFYLFPRVGLQGTKWKDDKEFVTKLLEETGVLVVHGSGFDPVYGSGHFRSVFLPEESTMSEALDAIDGFMKRHF